MAVPDAGFSGRAAAARGSMAQGARSGVRLPVLPHARDVEALDLAQAAGGAVTIAHGGFGLLPAGGEQARVAALQLDQPVDDVSEAGFVEDGFDPAGDLLDAGLEPGLG